MQIESDLEAKTINNVPVEDFVLKGAGPGPVLITGRKNFTKDVAMRRPFEVHGPVNGYDLNALWQDSLKINGNQTIRDTFIIQNDVSAIT